MEKQERTIHRNPALPGELPALQEEEESANSITGSDIEFKTAAEGSKPTGQIPKDYGFFDILNFFSRMHLGSVMLDLRVRGVF